MEDGDSMDFHYTVTTEKSIDEAIQTLEQNEGTQIWDLVAT